MQKNFLSVLLLNPSFESTIELGKVEVAALSSFRLGILEVKILENESMSDRISTVLEAMGRIKPGMFDLVVLPELWTEGAFDLTACQNTDFDLQNYAVTQLANFAKMNNIFVHAGTFPMKSKLGKIYNTALVFNPLGECETVYEKIHLFGFLDGERTVFEPGHKVVKVDMFGIGFGISTCYDLRFSELYLRQVSMGAKVLLVSASWPEIRIKQWKALLIARAIEGQVFVIGCNSIGKSGSVKLGGCSAVVDPFGNLLKLKVEGDFKICTLDISLLDDYRRTFPMLQDRVLPSFTQ